MKMSEQINELATALSKSQGEIENASKSSTNPHFRAKYADLAEVLNVCRPVFSSNGLSFSQCPSYEAGVVSVETILMHNSGQWISSTISAPVDKQNAQGVGSAITYCRRYSLAAVCGIAQEDDDAEASIGRGQAKQQKPKQETQQAEETPERKEYKRIMARIEGAKDVEELTEIMVLDKEAISKIPEAGQVKINAESKKRLEALR